MSEAVLTVDQGNTRTKTSVVAAGEILCAFSSAEPSLEPILALTGKYRFRGAIYCSVARLDVRFIESLRNMLEVPVEVLTHSTPLPIAVDYLTPRTLGLDRIAAAVAADSLAGGVPSLVIDAGTAVTMDIVDAASAFRGGNISPGLALRFKALHDFTGRLPLVDKDDETPAFGRDTDTAIRAGVVNGFFAEINDTIRRARSLFGVEKVFVTGGDASFIAAHPLAADQDLTIVPELIPLGLDIIFRYNDSLNNENP